ncbi:hypothetical protein [Thalassospira australica]|uniref:hypothetical protein n=1 Tax=Thalassospira australica TaxID=1528106 RepID=UPI0012E00930|nr:hypothetical protein [Thalassospira australica]
MRSFNSEGGMRAPINGMKLIRGGNTRHHHLAFFQGMECQQGFVQGRDQKKSKTAKKCIDPLAENFT